MKTFLKVLLFLLSFQLEVRVKADSGSETFSADKKPFHLSAEDVKIHAAVGSTFEKTKSGDWKILRGNVWVEKAQHKNFETPYLTADGKSGEFWIDAQADKTWIRNFSAILKITLRDGKTLDIPPGFQMWAAGFNSEAQVEYGMIEPIAMREQIPQWYAIYPASGKNFENKIKKLKESWGDVAETGSQIYKAQALRKIASVEAADKAVADRKRRIDAENKRVRELYMQRTFER